MGDMALDFEGGFVSPQDYLRREARSQTRHEYIDGQVYAMGGGSVRHALLCGNFFAALHARLSPDCRVFASDLKAHVKNDATERYYYPDIVVACERQEQSSHICAAPLMICEVLSPSTERFDRTEKFEGYQLSPSLREYVLVAQNAQRVELFRRENDWRREAFAAGDEFALNSLSLSFAVDEIYKGVDWEC